MASEGEVGECGLDGYRKGWGGYRSRKRPEGGSEVLRRLDFSLRPGIPRSRKAPIKRCICLFKICKEPAACWRVQRNGVSNIVLIIVKNRCLTYSGSVFNRSRSSG